MQKTNQNQQTNQESKAQQLPLQTNRIAFCDIICGINGTGKTTLLKQIIMAMHEAGHRVLVVTPDAIEWGKVPEITQKRSHNIATFSGMRRIVYYNGCMEDIQRYYSNGVLVFDDARVYIHAQSNDFMTWLQIRRRQCGIDLFSVFHGLTQVPPIYFTFSSRLFLFYTKDNIKRRGVYVDEDDFKMINEAKKRVNAKVEAGDKYFYELLNLDKRL